ncbi:MAG: flippase-like domain-containing protein [Fluviicola sp.]|nr:flippase-like domain-containing protein [Fluviicola sp.]
MKKSIGALLKIVLPLALGTYLIWYLFDSMNPEVKKAFYAAIYDANYWWILLSVFLSVFALFSRAYRWKYLLEPMGYETKFWHRFHALMIGYIVNLTIPRAGEASRAAMLFRSDGVPFSKSFGTILAERVVDVVLLLTVTLLTFYLTSADFIKIKTQIELSFSGSKGAQQSGTIVKWIIVALGVLGVVLVAVLPKLRSKVLEFVKGLIQGILSIFKTKHPFSFIAHTFFIWMLYVLYFCIPFLALDATAEVPFKGMLLAFVAGSVGISLTNGGLGVFPLVVGLVVEFYLSDKYGEQAKGLGYALGMIIWSSQTLLIILLGLLSFVLLPKNFSKNVEIPTPPQENS